MKKQLSHQESEMFARLKKLPDSQIDTTDIPEAPAENWRFARRGKRSE
jgi:hypothetical protein